MAPLWRPSGRPVTLSRWRVNGQRARSLVPHRAGYNDDECGRPVRGGAGRGGGGGARRCVGLDSGVVRQATDITRVLMGIC